jgi:DNA-binding NtrC family response regulator
MERAVMLAKGDRISHNDIMGLLQPADPTQRIQADDYLSLPYAKAKEKVLEDFSRRYIKNKLDHHQGNVTHAAQEAGLPRPYFHEIMRRYMKEEK